MPLKTFVKVGNISNLSDARYCAGMGVDLLGFRTVEGNSTYMAPALFQEIRGWFSGPSIVAELYGLSEPSAVASIVQQYAPDYLEVGIAELSYLPTDISIPLIVKLDNENSSVVNRWASKIAFILLPESVATPIQIQEFEFPVVVELESKDHLSQLEGQAIKGIALNGTPELRPGFKDYSVLADVLEQLEVE